MDPTAMGSFLYLYLIFFFFFSFFFLGGGFGLELASACIYFGHGEHVFHGVKVFPSMIGLRSCKKFHIFMGAV